MSAYFKNQILRCAAGIAVLAVSGTAFAQANQTGKPGDQTQASQAHASVIDGTKEGADWVKAMTANAKAKEEAIDHELAPAYHKAKALQKAGKIDELDAFLLKMRLTKLAPMEYAESEYGEWMWQTLILDLMDKGDMRTIWIAEGKPKTKQLLTARPLGEAAAASIGITYPGEYQDLRKVLGWKSPDADWAKPFDRGDCAWSDEVLSLVWLDRATANLDLSFDKRESDFALKTLYYRFIPGNDGLFVSLLWSDGFSDPSAAMAAYHRHFPNGVSDEFASRESIRELLNGLSMAAQRLKDHPEAKPLKYMGPVK